MRKYPKVLAIVVAVLAVAMATAACSGGGTPANGAATPTTAPSPDPVTDATGLPALEPPERALVAPADVPDEMRVVWETWEYLIQDYVDQNKVDPATLGEAAIRGMLAALDDPHTAYVPPEAFAVENEDIGGKFEGIGAAVEMRPDGKLIIVAPMPGSPAEASGIRPGDVILEVDGERVEGWSLLEAVARIRGPKGTVVRLLVKHLTELDPVLVEVERGVIPLTSVLLRSQPGDRLAHIRLTNFYLSTSDELDAMIRQQVDAGAQGVILDVRNNPGGLLSSVVDVASRFLADGVVVYEVDGKGRRTPWNVTPNSGPARDIPLVLLVNEYSASASEVLAGALQDYGRAAIVGATTFGKGAVNRFRPLSNGGGLYITYGRWYTPDGRLIQDVGIKPDYEVIARDPRDADVQQLEKAIAVLEAMVEGRELPPTSS